jgi:hypothetical protein
MQLDRQAQFRATSKTRAICAGEKAMPSQKPSTASTSPSAWALRKAGMADLVDIRVGPHSGGTGMRAEKTCHDPHRTLGRDPGATRSIFSSVSISRP